MGAAGGSLQSSGQEPAEADVDDRASDNTSDTQKLVRRKHALII
jgi:hypothetical protein